MLMTLMYDQGQQTWCLDALAAVFRRLTMQVKLNEGLSPRTIDSIGFRCSFLLVITSAELGPELASKCAVYSLHVLIIQDTSIINTSQL